MNEPICENSPINLFEFKNGFLWCCSKLKLPKIHRSTLLGFIKSILPGDNIIPRSYRRLIKDVKINKSKKMSICYFCSKELSDNSSCTNEDCKKNMTKNPYIESMVQCVKFNVSEQLIFIIKKQNSLIENYKGNLNFIK